MSPSGPRKKEHFVFPNPRCLRVRDLLFARTPKKKQIPHPVQKPNGIRNDIFFSVFPQPASTTVS